MGDPVASVYHNPNEEGEKHTTLLDAVLQKLGVDGSKRDIVSRVVIAGTVTSQDEPIRAFFEELMSPEFGHPQLSPFSGILVETPSNFLNLLEAPPKSLLKYLKDIQQRMRTDDELSSVFQDISILSYTDDIGDRSFPKWTTIDQAATGEAPQLETEALASSIVDTIRGLCEIGKLIYSKQELQMMQFLVSVKTTNPDYLPGVDTISAYVGPFGKENCLSLDEYLEVYGQPVDLKLSGETIWPVAPPLHY